MRVAICFSGAIREFKFCFPSIYKYLIEPLNADIFIHAWSNNQIDNSLKVTYKMKKDTCSKDYVINKLKPIKFIIDEYNRQWETQIIKESGFLEDELGKNIPNIYLKSNDKNIYKKYSYNALGMYYKIWKCNQLKCDYEKEHNFKYDIVIRARLDFVWNYSINMLDIIKCKDNEIYIINDSYVSEELMRITNDKFFLGNSQTMNKFCNLFNLIKEFNNKNIPVQGSDLMQYYLLKYFKYKLIGDKFYYYKFNYYFNKINFKNKKVYINLSNNLMESLCNEFLINGYQVFSNVSDSKILKRLITYCNYNQLKNNIIDYNYDYYVIDNFIKLDLNKINNNNVYIFDNIINSTNNNFTYITLKCKIYTKNINKFSENECNIIDLIYYIYNYITNNKKESIVINGSYNYIYKKDDIVIYNTWENENKIKRDLYYTIIDINDNLYTLKLYDKKYSEYDQKILKKVKIMKNCSKKFMLPDKILNTFFNNKIFTRFI